MTRPNYFGIGIECCKYQVNYGTLFRSAYILGASFVFVVNAKFQKQSLDTIKTWNKIPTYSFPTIDDLKLPYSCQLVGIEMHPNATPLEEFTHPKKACYLLGSESNGLSVKAISLCHHIIKLQGDISMNVAVAGSVVIYHRKMTL